MMNNATQASAPGALIDAIKRGNMKTVMALLEQGVDVNEKEKFTGTTPLIMAACQDRVEIIRLLLDRDARIDEEDREGFTAMLRAVQNNNEVSACLLIENGADVDHKNDCDTTALMYASRQNRLITVQKLIDYDAKIDAKDKSGSTALSLAQDAGLKEIVQVIEPRLAEIAAREAAAAVESALRASHNLAVERQARLRAAAPRLRMKTRLAP